MIDLDGVVLDKKYQTTKDISKNVERAAQNLLLVPNSDTPILRLEKFFFDALGFRCQVVIGELGATLRYYNSLIQTCQIFGLDSFISQIKDRLKSIGAKVFFGDSTTWIREGKCFQSNCKIVLIDALRTQSTGLFFLETTDAGNTTINNVWSSQCMNVLQKIDRPKGLTEFCYNGKYGFVGCNAEGITKTNGYLALKKLMPKAQFFMIGDSDIDIINDPDIIHLAVANGTNGLKLRAKFISNQPYTGGLGDCLDWILKNI